LSAEAEIRETEQVIKAVMKKRQTAITCVGQITLWSPCGAVGIREKPREASNRPQIARGTKWHWMARQDYE